MNQRRPPSRRGAALLVVLAALIVVTTLSVTLARLASTSKAGQILAQRSVVADDLLRAVDAPILAWLASDSSTVVLPPDATSPRVGVLHDSWVAGDDEHELHVTAWDQCGMVPIGVARSGSPLRLAVPAEVLRVLDQVSLAPNQPAGLDLVLAVAARGASARIDVFPEAVESQPIIFGPPPDQAAPGQQSRGEPGPLACGAYVATHNPGRINVNTAPVDLIEAALRLAGRGGLEQITAARSEGRLATLGDVPSITDPNRNAPQIATTSNAWAFRIDIRVGSLRRSWWAVYARSRSTWECVQRLVIPE